MDTKTLLELRKRAEKAIADMADGPLKVKAFEVILANLLSGPQEPLTPAAQQRQEQKQIREAPAKTLTARILAGGSHNAVFVVWVVGKRFPLSYSDVDSTIPIRSHSSQNGA